MDFSKTVQFDIRLYFFRCGPENMTTITKEKLVATDGPKTNTSMSQNN